MNSTFLLESIQSYLGNGGFFNPEMMPHTKPAEHSFPCSPDVIIQIVKRLEGL